MVMQINKILLHLYLLVVFSFSSYADGINEDYETYSRISGTINLGPLFTKGKMKLTSNQVGEKNNEIELITWGMVIGAETSLFITDKIAFELFALANFSPINKDAKDSFDKNITSSKSAFMIYVPLGVGLNFHPFPFGGLDPYIGFGGEYDLIFSTVSTLTTENAFTYFGKFGVSLIRSNNSIMSLEVKKSFLTHNLKITNLHNSDYIMTLEPLIISFNFGYNI